MSLNVQTAALAQGTCPLTSQCGLDRALAWLYGAAGMLVLVLVIVVVGAIVYYVKNKSAANRSGGPR